MTMTNEQMKLLETIENNKETLDELFRIVAAQKQIRNLEMRDSIEIAGITWSKFAEDEEGNSYMLADETICDMEFGENNNWRESPIREMLNDELYKKIIDELGAESIVRIKTDLFSHDGLRDYGECEDFVSLLTYDLYRNNRENIKKIDTTYWLSTPNSTPSGYGSDVVQYVFSDGYVHYNWCDRSVAVRPFFILKS